MTSLEGLSWFTLSVGSGRLPHAWLRCAASLLPRPPLQAKCNFTACSKFTAVPSTTDSRPPAVKNEEGRQCTETKFVYDKQTANVDMEPVIRLTVPYNTTIN